MATKQDFTETEWATLQKGITGSGMLVSLSDRDFTDSFGEAGAMGKYLSGQQLTGATDLIRELAKVRGTGFGLTTPPDRLRNETIAAVTASVELLGTKSPDDVEPYRAPRPGPGGRRRGREVGHVGHRDRGDRADQGGAGRGLNGAPRVSPPRRRARTVRPSGLRPHRPPPATSAAAR